MINHSVTVFISGDDFLIKKGIKALVQTMPDYNAVELFRSSLFESFRTTPEKPQLLIHEFERPEASLFEQIEKINQTADVPVLLIMGSLEKTNIQRFIQLGVKGIITKKCSKEEIVNAIGTTIKGERFFCGKVLAVLFDEKEQTTSTVPSDKQVLTPRETEVLTLITKGNTTQQIAGMLHLSIHTVNSHRKNILKKLDLKSPVELILYALEHNLVEK